MLSDTSLVCQFNLEQCNDLITHLAECVEELFSLFHYKVKKAYTSSGEKVWSPGYKKFKSFENPDYFDTIRFQSDYNSNDFEPQTNIYMCIDNSWTKGTPYVLPKPLVKFTVVVNDSELLINSGNVYRGILLSLSNIPQVKLTGYSFQIPSVYGPVSLSFGILRKPNMPHSLQNLARWYRESDTKRSTIGLFNCFTKLSEQQICILNNLFGKENVQTKNGITCFKNGFMNTSNLDYYFASEEYNGLCKKLESDFCFLRNDYIG